MDDVDEWWYVDEEGEQGEEEVKVSKDVVAAACIAFYDEYVKPELERRKNDPSFIMAGGREALLGYILMMKDKVSENIVELTDENLGIKVRLVAPKPSMIKAFNDLMESFSGSDVLRTYIRILEGREKIISTSRTERYTAIV